MNIIHTVLDLRQPSLRRGTDVQYVEFGGKKQQPGAVTIGGVRDLGEDHLAPDRGGNSTGGVIEEPGFGR